MQLDQGIGAAHGQVWRGPEPNRQHRLLLTACREPTEAALAAWNRWIQTCRFNDQDPASFELASLAVGRLGALAGEGSEAVRCRGWTRRASFFSRMATEATERLQEASLRLGLPLIGVGDIATFRAGLQFSGRPFPVRSLEFHVPGASKDDLRQLHAAAMQGAAGEAIRTRRLALILRPDARHPDVTTPAGHIVWLANRNWCRFPPGRIRWILEVAAILESAAEPDMLPLQVVGEACRIEAIAAVAEAFRWIHATSHDRRQLDALVTALSAQPTSCSSRIRLWHARHQIGLGLRPRYSRYLQQAR
ncbi:MAG: hypothetical protein KFB97_15750 [Cyanobium sp. M30B3]|jgi:hypothetical protein|nr:MAG: hypothetical protein KFB97_15750 [Cyanobium sp. M30B3]